MEYLNAIYPITRRRAYRSIPIRTLVTIPPYYGVAMSELPGLIYERVADEIRISNAINERLSLTHPFEFVDEDGDVWIMLESIDDERTIRNQFGERL